MKHTSLAPRAKSIMALLRSNKLFWILFGIFLIEAIWIALSGVYSMAYDEYVHYGTIQLYAHQWLPFMSQQPHSADAYGAITRDPSYLYHYLMSFPLRVFAHYVHSQTTQIIFLRMFDIAFFATGVLLFRRLFQAAKTSLLVSNLALGFFLALPVAPFVAAQVNYDDVLFMLTAATVLLAIRIEQSVRTRRLVAPTILLFGTLALLASLVKYAYLPVLVALVGYLVVSIARNIGVRPSLWLTALRPSLPKLRSVQGVLLALFFIVSVGLFAERYGINIVRYHSPTPECNQVMTLDRCKAYGPFVRNYNYHQGHYPLPAWKVAVYPFNNWIRGMMRSLFFVVGNKENGYPAGEPFPLAKIAGYIVLLGGSIMVAIRFKWLRRANSMNGLLLTVVIVYVALLFLQNFMDFMHTHVAVAIQGRYLVPILPLLLVLVAQAAVGMLRAKRLRVGLSILAVLCFMMLEGGGIVPFIVRSNDAWLWQAPPVIHTNDAARSVLWPLVIGKNIKII